MASDHNIKFSEIVFDVAEHTNAMLAYWDKDLICRFSNKAYIDWFGITPDDMINKMHIRDVIGSTLYEKNLAYINGALNGQVQVFELLISTPSGVIRNSRATYIPDVEDSEVKGFYVHIADISPLNTTQSNSLHNTPQKVPGNLFLNAKLLEEVVETLKSCVLTAFPSIAKLAKKHFISESKLKRDFKAKYKTTIFLYYRNLQMEFADKYISEKLCNKNQMAVMLNFSNPSNFSACYQRYLKERSTKELISDVHAENDERYKTFIEQAPIAIAMFDKDMRFLAVSQKWILDYNLQNTSLIGRSIYDILPTTKLNYEAMYLDCLKGNINTCDEALIEKDDGSTYWLKWDIRPWYKSAGDIGGLLVYTEDITEFKLREEKNKQTSEILSKTSEISRIGTWTMDFRTKTAVWNKVLKEIMEVPEDFVPDMTTSIKFYKEGESRKLGKKVFKEALIQGRSFDIEVDMITARGNLKRIRIIGYPEFYNGKCEKLSGIFHDITKQYYEALNRK
jgi:PAS domain S-box-containing protein